MVSDAVATHEWHVVKVREDVLEQTLNELEQAWEIFSVTPTIRFGGKFMGAPVPSDVLYTVIARRHKDEVGSEDPGGEKSQRAAH